MSRRTLAPCLSGVFALALFACGDGTGADEAPADPQPPAAPGPEADPETGPEVDPTVEPGDGYDVVGLLGRCVYANPFSGGEECKAYTGTGWSIERAEADCADEIMGAPGRFDAELDCGFASELGRCAVGESDGEGHVLVFAGDDPDSCQATVIGCETFAGGSFDPGAPCGGDTVSGVSSGEAFIFGEQVCAPPSNGVAGQGPDGTVCTWDGIQGCTEEGRRFVEESSCDTAWRQRGYYPVAVEANTAPDDPRLDDDAYMGEMQWLTAQVESCSCNCCHSEAATPNGPSMWFVEDGPIWIDSVSDAGLAMFAGFADSEAFGAYPAIDNNGFDRSRTGLPTTDVERMQAFLRAELERRGVEEPEDEDWFAFGGPLVSQARFTPEMCDAEDGIVDGRVNWTGGGARYVYILEEGADNPGTPPNLFQPEGTLWQVMVDPADAPFGPGFAYGELPSDAAFQAVPGVDAPPTLVPGETYYLYVLADIIRPLARCTFVYEG